MQIIDEEARQVHFAELENQLAQVTKDRDDVRAQFNASSISQNALHIANGNMLAHISNIEKERNDLKTELEALSRPGMIQVPIVPTVAMWSAGQDQSGYWSNGDTILLSGNQIVGIYNAMIEARFKTLA
jgi:hypothetical protein